MKIQADNLQEAYSKAAQELSCSVTELDISVIQRPSSGILGFFKKEAIIEACKKSQEKQCVKTQMHTFEKKQAPTKEQKHQINKKSIQNDMQVKKNNEKHANISEVFPQIQQGVIDLVQSSCFNIDKIEVSIFDNETISIELNGEDAALLIGKEGYRYKAFSYLLYNWINIKYGLGIRLEIAEFLKNQEAMIDKYLNSVIERINTNGRGQTKPLDGVLIKIALEKLREKFPEKYVGIKTGKEGAKFIVVNDFNRK